MRYQVIITDSTSKKRSKDIYGKDLFNFTSNAKANKMIKELKGNNIVGELWDCYDNPLSNLFKF